MNNKLHTHTETLEALARILDVLAMLRANCPWDKVQTNQTLRANTIEEVFELADALLRDDEDEIVKELGDVLLHVLFYAKIGQEKGTFDLATVCNRLADKLIFRHPHIFGQAEATTQEAVSQQWERVKQREKGGNKTLLSGVPHALPSMIKAYRISEKAAAVGFDWEQREDIWEKVAEEQRELQEAVAKQDLHNIEEEFGDLFFALVNAARLYGVNPDNALERTNKKFSSRISYLEEKAKTSGRSLSELSFEEMNSFWTEAKSLEQDANDKK